MPYDPIQRFYESNPRMISSPFGGIDGINTTLLSTVLDELGIDFSGRRVVDAGCGRGYIADLVAARGGHYAGVDFVISRKGFPLIRADVARMPFASGSADVLLCVDSSEHFPDPAAAALEFYRVLRPGGVFFLSAPNYGNVAGLVKWACEGVGLYKKHTWAPFGRWQPQELEQPLTPGFVRQIYGEAGFQVTRAIGHAPEVGLGLFPWVDHPRMPESIQFRLQRLFSAVGPRVVDWAPSASLHLFWRMDKPGG
ncbi:MAG: class I SAM-dependent methyltransferase [Candidatus Hydrogenedentes bacterium]|nr:class I SAM-dependent methyltransferase [Candidatus Hydrogenedentota bacterium]